MAFVSTVIPQIGLGTSGINNDEIIIEALKQGYRHIDTGSWYGTHKYIKSALEKTAKDIPRSEIYITTKIWVTEQRDVPRACQKALTKLGIDYIDCYLTHFPYAILPDATDFDFISRQEVWTQMEKLVDNGKVKSIGVSNHTVALSIDMMASARIKPVVNQYEANPYCQRKALTRLMQRFGIQPVAFTPIGGKESLQINHLQDNILFCRKLEKNTTHQLHKLLLLGICKEEFASSLNQLIQEDYRKT